MPAAIIISEGQTTIPKEIRELLGLQSGDRMWELSAKLVGLA